ncbi:Putative B3 domain-containing protein At2g27410 [Linum perenne]
MTMLPWRVVRRRSPRRLRRRGLSAFESLLDAAAGECGCGGHSHLFTCKPAFLGTHHSLFLIPPKKTIAKRRLVFLPPKRPPIAASTAVSFLLPPHQASSPPILSSFSKDEIAVANIMLDFSLQQPLSSPATTAVNVSPETSAVAPLPPLRLRVLLPTITDSPTEVPKDLFPPILKSRVSAIVPCVLENTFALVIRKKLTDTDLSKRHVRLAIPGNQVANDFLTDGEKTLLEKMLLEKKLSTTKKCPAMDLGVFLDPKLEPISGGQLVMWMMKETTVYNITKAWKPILDKKKENRLKLDAGDEIELWSFRVASGELCFVMVSEETRRTAATGTAKKETSAESILTQEEVEIENPLLGFGDCNNSSSAVLDLTLRL